MKHQNTLENASPTVLKLVLAGLGDAAVCAALAHMNGSSVVCHKSAVYAWRKRHAGELEHARAAAREQAVEAAISSKAERLRLYQRLVDVELSLIADLQSAEGTTDLETARILIAAAGGGVGRLLRNVAEEQGELYSRRATLEPVGGDRDGREDLPAPMPSSETTIERVIIRRYPGINIEEIG